VEKDSARRSRRRLEPRVAAKSPFLDFAGPEPHHNGVRYISSRSELRVVGGSVEGQRPVGSAETIVMAAYTPVRTARARSRAGLRVGFGSRWAVRLGSGRRAAPATVARDARDRDVRAPGHAGPWARRRRPGIEIGGSWASRNGRALERRICTRRSACVVRRGRRAVSEGRCSMGAFQGVVMVTTSPDRSPGFGNPAMSRTNMRS
jgi:hypothetical protein